MNALKLIASSSFITVNIELAKVVGLEASVMLGELASSQLYWEERGELEDGMFFETVEMIEDRTTLTKYQQAKAVKDLEEAGVLRTVRKGIPAKRYFSVNGEKLSALVDNKKSKNLTTGSQKTSQLEVKKLDCNKKREKENRETRKENNNTVSQANLSEPVREKLIDFLDYRKEIKKPYKSDRSLKALVTQVERQEQQIGATAVIAVIDKTMENGWQGLYWDKASKPKEKTGVDAIFGMIGEGL